MVKKKIEVDFKSEPPRKLYTPQSRRYGGCGIMSKPEPYAGPKERPIEIRGRKFVVVRLNHSPTGSGHGSFRIDELKKDGRISVRGFTCSYPDEEDCLRVANAS